MTGKYREQLNNILKKYDPATDTVIVKNYATEDYRSSSMKEYRDMSREGLCTIDAQTSGRNIIRATEKGANSIGLSLKQTGTSICLKN